MDHGQRPDVAVIVADAQDSVAVAATHHVADGGGLAGRERAPLDDATALHWAHARNVDRPLREHDGTAGVVAGEPAHMQRHRHRLALDAGVWQRAHRTRNGTPDALHQTLRARPAAA